MARVHGRIEQVVHFLGGLVAVHQYFLDDHLALGFELVLAQCRPPDDLREDVEAEVGRLSKEPDVKRRVLLGGERVQVSPDCVDQFGDLTGAALGGPFEQQVLQEMRGAGDRFGLVYRTRTDPEPEAHRQYVGHVLGDYCQAPVDDRGLDDVAGASRWLRLLLCALPCHDRLLVAPAGVAAWAALSSRLPRSFAPAPRRAAGLLGKAR